MLNMQKIGLLQKEPISFDQRVETLQDCIEEQNYDLGEMHARILAEELNLTWANSPVLFNLDKGNFCVAILNACRRVEIVKLI